MPPSPLPDVGIELREGYADVGDQKLHYVEAGDGPLIVLLHGFPEFWFGWRLQIEPLAAAGFRVVAPDHAWLQPVIEARGLRGLCRRPARRRHPRPDRRTRCRVRAVGRSRLGREHRLDRCDEPSRGGRATRHPERGPSAAALGGAEKPEPAPEVLVLLLLRDTGTARADRARQGLALLPPLPARRQPSVHAGGTRTLRRGVVTGRRSSRDDQLLPRLGTTVPEGSRSEASSDLGADPGDLGRARFLPRLRPRRAPRRRCAQP